MKTFLTRTLSLIVCLAAGAVAGRASGSFPFELSYQLQVAAGIAFFALFWHSRHRCVPLLLCIEIGAAISWVSIYSFWFAIWTFHSVPAARAFDAVGSILLSPARWTFEGLGGDQSAIFFDPESFAGTNGLILGILIYGFFRATRRPHRAEGANGSPAPQFTCTLRTNGYEHPVPDSQLK